VLGNHAVRVALRLLADPHGARELGTGRLPSQVIEVLKLAARAPDALDQWSARLEVPPDRLVEAAVFFIEQVLMVRDASHYRVLGLEPWASADAVRAHYRWLMHRVHPDRASSGWHAVLAERVNRAYAVLRNPERRQAYDVILWQELHPSEPASAVPVPLTEARSVAPRAIARPRRDTRRRTWALIAAGVVAVLIGVRFAGEATPERSPPTLIVVSAKSRAMAPTSAAAPSSSPSALLLASPTLATANEHPAKSQLERPRATTSAAAPARPPGWADTVSTPSQPAPAEARAVAERFSHAYAAGDVVAMLNLMAQDDSTSTADVAAAAAEIERHRLRHGSARLQVTRLNSVPDDDQQPRIEVVLRSPDSAGLRLRLRESNGAWRIERLLSLDPATASTKPAS
jgi:hypothetical protein